MIDPKNDLKFTTAGDYMDDLHGSETWQTKANEKNKVPRYMSPAELAHMRLDKQEESLLRLAKRIDKLERQLSDGGL